jgi:hypothetical protein
MTPNYPKKLETNEQQQQEEKWILEPPFAVKKGNRTSTRTDRFDDQLRQDKERREDLVTILARLELLVWS